ncbi:DUF1941-domain-containing protein [Xylariaceae sp. FL0804]|nr:DUF1941-domain-containing protein [Xylariaceae sp. FL0804]
MSSPDTATQTRGETNEVERVHRLLTTKDDTSRFVGLLLLRSLLDNSQDLRDDQAVVSQLWNSISPKFLDRLIRSVSKPPSEQQDQSKDMLELAVAVVRTFTGLTPDYDKHESFYGRVPHLTRAVFHCSGETTQQVLELLGILVRQPDGPQPGGATVLAKLGIDDWTVLIEVAPQYLKEIFAIFHWAWITGSIALKESDQVQLRDKIDQAIVRLFSSFKSDNADGLLEFVASILQSVQPQLLSPKPAWLGSAVRLLHAMAAGRQTAAQRHAHASCAAALLRTYPQEAAEVLFIDSPDSPKPLAYLMVTMVQVDFQATAHLLMPKLRSPEYLPISQHLASILDILTAFVGRLVASVDGEDEISVRFSQSFTSERILKLHSDLARTISDAMELLRDRFDAHLMQIREAGDTVRTLSWNEDEHSVFDDPIIPAAVRLLGAWLPEDDGDTLREQATGLMDLYVELYKRNLSSDLQDSRAAELRLPILAALEGIFQTSRGPAIFDEHDWWSSCLYPDLRGIISAEPSGALGFADYLRGSAIIRALKVVQESEERPSSAWTSILEAMVSYHAPSWDVDEHPREVFVARAHFQIEALELASDLLRNPDVRRGDCVKGSSALRTTASKISEQLKAGSDEEVREIASRVDEIISAL